jgi:hypothetical protein
MMIPTPTFRIESYTPDEAQLKAYALAFRDAHTRWQNYLGDAIYMSDGGFEEDAEDLREAIVKARPSRLVALLKKYEALPEKLYRITNIASGKSASLPIYTDIPEISLEGRGSVLAKAFFGAEVHLLDHTGRQISRYDHEYAPQLGIGQHYLIDCNSLYDSQVKGRRDDPTAMEIVGYAPGEIDRTLTIQTQKGKEYGIRQVGEDSERIFKGTGGPVTIEGLERLGTHHVLDILKKNKDGLPVHMETRSEFHVGLEWKHMRDFTIQYNTFPFLSGRDAWVMTAIPGSVEENYKTCAEYAADLDLLETMLKKNPCSFQFMPPEIRGDRAWVEKFCLKAPVNFLSAEEHLRNDRQLAIDLIRQPDKFDDTVYPYLPESLRKDLDILIVLKENGRLFHLPDPESIGYLKLEDIRNFVNNYRSRIHEVLDLFPNALRYAPDALLNDRQLLLQALPKDPGLVAILPEHLRNDEEIIAAACDKYSASLKYASDRLRKDPIFVMRMIEKYGQNICFAADRLKTDRTFVLAAAPAGSNILKHVPDHFRDDEEIMLKMVKHNGFCLDKASMRLRLDKSFNLKALELGAYYRHNIHESLQEDRDIVLKAMQQHPHEFEHIPQQFKADREIVRTVVSTKGGYGKYIKDCPLELREDPGLIKAAVNDNEWNIKHAGPKLLEDRYFLEALLHDHPACIQHLPDDMKFDPGLRELADRRKTELKGIKSSEPQPSHKPEADKENDEQDELPF